MYVVLKKLTHNRDFYFCKQTHKIQVFEVLRTDFINKLSYFFFYNEFNNMNKTCNGINMN